MKRMMLLAAVAILSACASGPPFKPYSMTAADSSLLYVYRPYVFQGAGASPRIYVDDNLLGTLKAGGYTVVELEPGGHTILVGKKEGEWVNWNPDSVHYQIDTEARQQYYYRLGMDFSDVATIPIPAAMGFLPFTVGKVRVLFDPIAEGRALIELRETTLN